MQTQTLNNVLLIDPRLWNETLAGIAEAQEKNCAIPMQRPASRVEDDYDVVPVSGVLMRAVPEQYRAWGLNATGYDEIAENVKAAAASSRKAIVLNVNSGGGLVDGIDIALAALREAASVKPVLAFIDGMCASAAYWLTSQATGGIYATRFSEVGSIGAYTVMYDTAKAAEKYGEKAVVSRSGDQKGAGIYGDPITEKMKAVQDDAVNQIAAMFMSDVVAARGDVNPGEVNSGRTWLATQAKELKLIDGVVKSSREIQLPANLQGARAETPEPVTQTVATDNPEPQTQEVNTMTENVQDAVQAERARVTAIAQAFASDPAFAQKHIQSGSTLEAAKAEHYDIVMARNAAIASLDSTPAPVASAEPKEEPKENFMARANRVAFERGIPLHKATAELSRVDRAGYLAAIGVKGD